MSFVDLVHAAVRRIPAGRVASYGDVAAAAGRPGAARGVGRALRSIGADDVPWWRVINARGELSIPRSGHARPLQRALLEREGVRFDEMDRVDMRRYRWSEADDDID